MFWQSFIRPTGIILSRIGAGLNNRRQRKLVEKATRLDKRLVELLNDRHISEQEAENVIAYLRIRHRGETDQLAMMVICLESYTELLLSGQRYPASEEAVWKAGYHARKRAGRLTTEDVERARTTIKRPLETLYALGGASVVSLALCILIAKGGGIQSAPFVCAFLCFLGFLGGTAHVLMDDGGY